MKTKTFPPGDQINVENIVEDDEQHPLVGQEDQPLPAQSLQVMDYGIQFGKVRKFVSLPM